MTGKNRESEITAQLDTIKLLPKSITIGSIKNSIFYSVNI